MAQLVTRAEVRDHLMVDNNAVDPWIDMMILAISGAVISWLKDEWRAYETEVDSNGEPIEDSNGDQFPILDSNGDPTTKPMVKAATLVEIASQFRFRDGDGVATVPSNWGHGHVLCMGATSLLVAARKPTVK
jgi:hypothetical protein